MYDLILQPISIIVTSMKSVEKVYDTSWMSTYFVIFQLSVMTMLGCYVLLLHLSYYMVGFYIDLLRISLTMDRRKMNPYQQDPLDTHGGIVGPNSVAMLRKSRYIFHILCKAMMELNSVFSFPSLVAICTRLITMVSSLFFLIYQIIKPNPLMESTQSLFVATFFIDWFAIFVFFSAADMPIKKVKVATMIMIYGTLIVHPPFRYLTVSTSPRSNRRRFQQHER